MIKCDGTQTNSAQQTQRNRYFHPESLNNSLYFCFTMLSFQDIQSSAEKIQSYFCLPLNRAPVVEFDSSILAEARCYHRHTPDDKIIINPQAEMTRSKGLSWILDHAMIHWIISENNLNKYKSCPSHIPHVMYYGKEEQQRLEEIANPKITADIFFGRHSDPQQRETLLRFVDQHYNTLRQRVVQYSKTSGEATEKNIMQIEAILQDARAFSMRHTLQTGEQAIYSFICQDYADLLSAYGGEKLGGPASAIAFLRELRSKQETIIESIGNTKLTSFLNFEKYATLLEQFSSFA